MSQTKPSVTIIPAKPPSLDNSAVQEQLQVAAYCRVSTDDEEQLSSYMAQQAYYTDKIMSNPNWAIAGIFADEGITGTSARKRPEFQRMIRKCNQGKIDIILVKSISRFARNTVDCLNYIRALKEKGIAVIFEKENINTLDADSEVFLSLYGAFAQAESESISGNVRWGKRQAMKEGKVNFQYKHLLGYKRGSDGLPEIIPEEAEIVRRIFREYLQGASVPAVITSLERDGIQTRRGKAEWSRSSIRNILKNEKYCGDVLMQKTYILDCISKKVIKNTGQLPMYLIKDHHEAIIDRKTFDAVQSEIARRSASKSLSKKTSTGKSSYAGKYALSERLICGECGSHYRRITWVRDEKKTIMWRCISRVEFGKKYCHNSPSLEEGRLQRTILAALNRSTRQTDSLFQDIAEAAEEVFASNLGGGMSLTGINRRLEEISNETMAIVTQAADEQDKEKYTSQLKALMEEAGKLKEMRSQLEGADPADSAATTWTNQAKEALATFPAGFPEWDEVMIRQLIKTVKVVSATKIEVILRDGAVIEQDFVE